MNNPQTLLIVLAVIGGTAVILRYLLPWIKQQGVDMQSIIDQIKTAMGVMTRTLDLLKPFREDTAGDKLRRFDAILTAVRAGVGNAEQLYYTGQLTGEERKAEALVYIRDTLTAIGIELTPEVERIIGGALESEVLALGHRLEAAELQYGVVEFGDDVERA